MEVISTDKAPAAIGPYSQAIKTGNLLFCSGQIPLDPATGDMVPGDVKAQAKQVMENIEALLAAAGAGFDNIVKTTIFLVDMADFAAVNEVYGSRFQDYKPARSTVAVRSLPRGALLEIEVVAAL
ncbi:RidA family protein [Geobacter sp. SVR]|uniref:RidA family protein n=1 Tax=Geobacter sp. SVR TaxID=2495594 RepID=UPI00143EF56D|nr:RidA family protein [Geobacter sp. SVR]BCS53593.1 reactive intermediate/imine deaminase [Geobacter sp. SVR]GCF84210.1 reactive intermediate/imine deaminase [Geobacter sp. SVR]